MPETLSFFGPRVRPERRKTALCCAVVMLGLALGAAQPARSQDALRKALSDAPKDLVVNGETRTNDTRPSMAVLSDGRTWMAWHAYRDGRDRVLARRVGPDGLGPKQRLSGEGAVHDAPVLVAGGDGTAWVFWETRRDGRWRLLGRQRKDGRWRPAVVLSDTSANAMMPDAASFDDGRVLLAWTRYDGERFRIYRRVWKAGAWSDPLALSSAGHDSFRPAVAAGSEGGWVCWDSYRNGDYVVRGRSVLPERGEPVRLSPDGAYAIMPTARATRHGLCVAWLQLRDVIGGAGVVSQRHTLRMAIRQNGRWRLARDADGGSAAATLTHGIMVQIEPEPEAKLGYMGRPRVPMLVEGDGAVWLLWDRKRNPSGHPQRSKGELVARPFRDGRWGETAVLHRGLLDYRVSADGASAGGRFFVLASQLPREDRRVYHRLVADFGERMPFEQAEWRGWEPVELPLSEKPVPRREVQLDGETHKLFWADLHNHTAYTCDAEGRIDETLRYARDRARIDAVAITDNDYVFNEPLTNAQYEKTVFHTRRMHREGRFVALPAYEWTSHLPGDPEIDRSDPRAYRLKARRRHGYGPDHRTVLYPISGGPLIRHHEVGNDIRRLHAAIEDVGGLALPQHRTWTPTGHPSEAGIEVTTSWGTYIEWRKKRYHRLLDEYRYGFLGFSDGHRRCPGLGGALTGIYAPELTDEALLEAIRERRVFATNGSRIVVDSRADGVFMGRQIRSEDGRVEITLTVTAPRPLVRVTLIRDGRAVQTFKPDGKRSFRGTYTAEGLKAGTHWCYWRIRQQGRSPRYPGNAKAARGHLAWSSPHWVTVPAPAGAQ